MLEQRCHLSPVTVLPVGASTKEQAVEARLKHETDFCQSYHRVGQPGRAMGFQVMKVAKFGDHVIAVSKVPTQ